jgi:hypothetical protein
MLHDGFADIMLRIKEEREKGIANQRASEYMFLIPFNLIAFMANEIEWWM